MGQSSKGSTPNDWKELVQKAKAGDFYHGSSIDLYRRFVSFNRRNLQAAAKKKYGALWREEVRNISELLSIGLGRPNETSLPDILMLNAFCALEDYLSAPMKDEMQKHLNSLFAVLRSVPGTSEVRKGKECCEDSVFRLSVDSGEMSKFWIFCPNPFSQLTAVTFELCRRVHLPIEGILVRSVSWHRFRTEFRRDGTRLLRKIWRKRVLKSDENAGGLGVSLSEVVQKLGIRNLDIRKQASRHDVHWQVVPDFIRPPQNLMHQQLGSAIFTGGGKVGREFLAKFSKGVVNVHLGLLPEYRGMDVVEHPILSGRFGSVGLTSHLMSEAIDEGPILQRLSVSSDDYTSLGSLRNELGAIAPFISVNSLLGLLSGQIAPKAQTEHFRQCYTLAPKLGAVCRKVVQVRGGSWQDPSQIRNFIDRFLKVWRIER